MKRKFILVLTAVMLIVALCAFALPAMVPDVAGGVAGAGAAAETADLAVLESQAVLIVDNTPLASSAATAGETLPWLALGASLLTLAVVYGRRSYYEFLNKNIDRRDVGGSINEGAEKGGGPNKFILPAAA